jgi:alpha-glucosidase
MNRQTRIEVKRAPRVSLAVVVCWLLVPAASHAATSIGSTQIVVSAPDARAVINRSPFRLVIETAQGRTALAEVANAQPPPHVLPPTVDPVPPGTDAQSSGELYAPLSFLVGTETIDQYQGLVWGGNLMSGQRSGVEYSAREVVRASSTGGGVSLTLSTDDPSGRTLVVEVAPAGNGLIGVNARAEPANGVAMLSDSFTSSPNEAFYGFGGRHNALDQHGRALSSWTSEENLTGPFGDSTGSLGISGIGSTVLFPNGPTAAYYPQAQFISSRGYGFMLDQSDLARFRLDSDVPDEWSVAASSPSLHYLVAPGWPPQAIADLTAVTGRQPVPPSWALGPMLDRLVKNVGESRSDYEAELNSDIANIDRYHLPLTAYRIEGWGLPGSGNDGLMLPTSTSFAVQSRIIAELQARGIHPLVYLRPFITPGSAPDREGLTIRQANGQTYYTTTTTGTKIALLDFTNPAAVRFWQQELDKAFDLGADGFMQDFGEEILDDMHFHGGETGATMHNRYPVLYAQATRAAITAYEQSHPGRRLWFFTRSGYSGTPGSAAFEGGNFPGDETTDWSQASGLASLAPDMLNRAIGGAYGYGTDIGGYYDYTTPPTTKELFLRWAEWAALSPVFRLHGAGLTGTHTPWSYDQQTVETYNALSLLHERAAPLILALWREAEQTGIPPTRPLWLQFPGDAQAAAQEQEWMLGDDVLVAPVVTKGATSRQVYFPTGCWQDPQTGLTVRGPRSATVAAPLTVLPFFFACGTHPFAATPRSRPPARFSCGKPSGRLAGVMLGPVRLGMTRAQARSRFARFSVRGRRYMDFFCPARRGIRVGYASPKLLHGVSRSEQRRVRGRVVLILTANRHYTLHGVRPDARLANVARRLRVGHGLHIGLNWWYLAPNGSSRGVLKVRHGMVQEIGIANARLTNSRGAQLKFLESFS